MIFRKFFRVFCYVSLILKDRDVLRVFKRRVSILGGHIALLVKKERDILSASQLRGIQAVYAAVGA